MSKKKNIKIASLIVAMGLLVGLAWLSNVLIGNPVSQYLAKKTAEEYLAENYGDTDFYIGRLGYDFKSMDYYAQILSPTSEDVDFYLDIDMSGKLIRNSYNSFVASGYNTGLRLAREYNDIVSDIFAQTNDSGRGYSYINGNLERGERWAISGKNELDASIPYYSLVPEDLIIDYDYDVKLLGQKHGTVCVDLTEENISYKRAAEILLWVKDEMDKAGVGFYAVDLNLQVPPGGPDGESAPSDASIYILSFPYSEIYPEGLEDRIEKAYKDLYEYWGEPVTYLGEE